MDGRDQLHALKRQLLADPDVTGWKIWPLADIPEVPATCPACGTRWSSQSSHPTHPEPCRCGLHHLTRKCWSAGCLRPHAFPEMHEGCGPLPHDPDARRR